MWIYKLRYPNRIKAKHSTCTISFSIGIMYFNIIWYFLSLTIHTFRMAFQFNSIDLWMNKIWTGKWQTKDVKLCNLKSITMENNVYILYMKIQIWIRAEQVFFFLYFQIDYSQSHLVWFHFGFSIFGSYFSGGVHF